MIASKKILIVAAINTFLVSFIEDYSVQLLAYIIISILSNLLGVLSAFKNGECFSWRKLWLGFGRTVLSASIIALVYALVYKKELLDFMPNLFLGVFATFEELLILKAMHKLGLLPKVVVDKLGEKLRKFLGIDAAGDSE